MNIREQLWKSRHGPVCRFGGSSSQASTNTTQNFDQRQVNTTTNNDFSNRSTNNTSYDLSNRSTNTTNNDFSNRSVNNSNNSTTSNFWDQSSTVTNISTTTTDFGAVAAAVALSKDVAGQAIAASTADVAHAYDYADQIFSSATDYANQNDARAMTAFDRAATITDDALNRTAEYEKAALAQVQVAYADAKGTTQAQQKIMLAVLAVAGLAVMFSMHKG